MCILYICVQPNPLPTDPKSSPKTTTQRQACEALIQAGIAPHVFALMARYLPVASLQEKCCMLLAALTEESARNIERVWGPEVCLMKYHAMKPSPLPLFPFW